MGWTTFLWKSFQFCPRVAELVADESFGGDKISWVICWLADENHYRLSSLHIIHLWSRRHGQIDPNMQQRKLNCDGLKNALNMQILHFYYVVHSKELHYTEKVQNLIYLESY